MADLTSKLRDLQDNKLYQFDNINGLEGYQNTFLKQGQQFIPVLGSTAEYGAPVALDFGAADIMRYGYGVRPLQYAVGNRDSAAPETKLKYGLAPGTANLDQSNSSYNAANNDTATPRVFSAGFSDDEKRAYQQANPQVRVTNPAPSLNNAPPTTGDIPTGSTSAPTPPNPSAPAVTSAYTEALNSDLEQKRKAVEAAYNTQLKDLEAKQADAQKKIDEFTKKQEGVLDKTKDLTAPFRAQLEAAERERLYITKNFEDNQKLVDELSTLLNEGNALIKQQQEVTGLASIRNPRINQTISDVAARAGVIQAVMSARNGQIAQAYNMIDRSVAATTADRLDQLSYYKTLYNFYENQKDSEGQKLVTLNSKESKFLDAQINLLESDMSQTQATANYLKEMMINPDTANLMAQAGVTLNDSIQTINEKMAKYTQQQVAVSEQTANRDEAFAAGVTTPFYNKSGTIIRTADGKAYSTPEQFFADAGISSWEEAASKKLISDFVAPQEAPTTDIAEYEYSKSQGFQGTFLDYIKQESTNRRAPSSARRASTSDGFTKTQLAQGAAAAGLTLGEFSKLPVDQQNNFIFGTERDLEGGNLADSDFEDFQKDIDDMFAEGAGLGEVRDAIDSSDIPQADKEELKQYAEDIAPEEGFFSGLLKKLNPFD